jgi:hypothetical protein
MLSGFYQEKSVGMRRFATVFPPQLAQYSVPYKNLGWGREHLRLRSDKTLVDLAKRYNPVVRGWINYYGEYYKSALYPVLRHLNQTLVKWACRAIKRLRRHWRQARHWLGRIAKQRPDLFAHWKLVSPEVGK